MPRENFVKIYHLHPNPDRIDEFITAMRKLAAALENVTEHESSELLIGFGAFDTALFIERWSSRSAYEKAEAQLDPKLFRALSHFLLRSPSVDEATSIRLRD